MPDSPYIPHNYINNSLVYTGTHDNNTTTGWYRQEADKGVRERLQQYAGQEVREGNVHQVLGRLAYASVAGTAILPAQDILGLAENARMNTPSSGENNWSWRMLPGQLTWNAEELLRKWAYLYNRD
jgi:4-alpha-glucanotransferase